MHTYCSDCIINLIVIFNYKSNCGCYDCFCELSQKNNKIDHIIISCGCNNLSSDKEIICYQNRLFYSFNVSSNNLIINLCPICTKPIKSKEASFFSKFKNQITERKIAELYNFIITIFKPDAKCRVCSVQNIYCLKYLDCNCPNFICFRCILGKSFILDAFPSQCNLCSTTLYSEKLKVFFEFLKGKTIIVDYIFSKNIESSLNQMKVT